MPTYFSHASYNGHPNSVSMTIATSDVKSSTTQEVLTKNLPPLPFNPTATGSLHPATETQAVAISIPPYYNTSSTSTKSERSTNACTAVCMTHK